MTRIFSPSILLTAILSALFFPGWLQGQEKSPSDQAQLPATAKIERGKLRVVTTAKGIFESDEPVELMLEMKQWTGPFLVKAAATHGALVKQGDIVLELLTDKIDQQILEVELERELAELSMQQLKDELPVLEKLLPLNLTSAEHDKRVADEDLKRYMEIEREHSKETSEFSVKSLEHFLEYAKEELKQLQKMYRDKDLTEETEEIILKRQRNEIEQIQFMVASNKLAHERMLQLELPRRDISLRQNAEKQALNLIRSKSILPLELNQKRVTLRKLATEYAKAGERLEQLKADRNGMTVRAPRSGIVGHGPLDRGEWNAAAISSKLRRGGALQANEVVLTIVNEKPNSLRIDVEEKALHALRPGLQGVIEPAGFPKLKLAGKLQRISPVPRSSGNFEGRVSLDSFDKSAGIGPGMAATVKFVTYQTDDALLAPTSAIFRDEGVETPYVFLVTDGKPTKTEIEVGEASGGKTEVLGGLKPGNEILLAKP